MDYNVPYKPVSETFIRVAYARKRKRDDLRKNIDRLPSFKAVRIQNDIRRQLASFTSLILTIVCYWILSFDDRCSAFVLIPPHDTSRSIVTKFKPLISITIKITNVITMFKVLPTSPAHGGGH